MRVGQDRFSVGFMDLFDRLFRSEFEPWGITNSSLAQIPLERFLRRRDVAFLGHEPCDVRPSDGPLLPDLQGKSEELFFADRHVPLREPLQNRPVAFSSLPLHFSEELL